MAVSIGLSVAMGASLSPARLVISFLGLDIVLLDVAFWAIYRSVCQSDRIRQTAQELELVFPDGTNGIH
jgi:uncharacterized membrane protein